MRFTDAPVRPTQVSFMASGQVLRKWSESLCSGGGRELRFIWNSSGFSFNQLIKLGIFQLHNVQFCLNTPDRGVAANELIHP